MSPMLIVYGTTDGHTRMVVQAVAETLHLAGVDTDVIQAGTLEPVVQNYSAITRSTTSSSAGS